MAVATRRQQRERSLELLYEVSAKAVPAAAVLEALPLAADEWVASLVLGVDGAAPRLDGLIAEHAIGWSVERMAVVDRTLLRVATFELLERPEVPTGVIIAEAVDLASRYSTEESGRFVNGVLAAIAAAVRPGEADPGS